jgi:hypothetical protein
MRLFAELPEDSQEYFGELITSGGAKMCYPIYKYIRETGSASGKLSLIDIALRILIGLFFGNSCLLTNLLLDIYDKMY